MVDMQEKNHIKEALERLNGWNLSPDGCSINKQFKFKDFSQAFAFMTQVALLAERHNHHPEWANVYNRVDIRLTTHEAGGVTAKDLSFAQLIEEHSK